MIVIKMDNKTRRVSKGFKRRLRRKLAAGVLPSRLGMSRNEARVIFGGELPNVSTIHSATPTQTPTPESKNTGLNEGKVRLIRKILAEREMTMTALAKEFGISRSTVSDIYHRRTWRNV